VKKLLHIQLLPLLSGVQNFSLHLLDGLPEGEFEIWVASQPGGEFVDAVRKRGYKYLPLRAMRHPVSLLDVFAFLELVWRIKRHRFDIVHTNSSKPGLLGRLAAKLCKVPLILHTAHGTAFQDSQGWLQKRTFMILEKLGNAWGDKTVFVNNSDRKNCLQKGLVSEAKAVTIYNALPEKLASTLAVIADARVFDPDKKDFVLGSTLRFSKQKNVVNLVSAACRACHEEPKLRFILLGEGEYLELCRQIVKTTGLNERVLLPGWDIDVAGWLAQFDAFILYSRWEAQPFSIIEAMHSGLAVLGSDIPSIAELVDGQTGWLVPLDKHKDLIDMMREMIRDPLSAREKGQAAHAKIARLCSYQQMVEGYLNIYRSLDVLQGEVQ
jgi:glycosyltransferase involved in cell wall biosynthesis